MVVDNINFPDNFSGPVLRHAAKKSIENIADPPAAESITNQLI